MFRREIEAETLAYAAAHDIGVLVYGPLAHGLLSGRISMDIGFAPDDWRADGPDFGGETLARNLAVVERLNEFAAGRDLSLPRPAVAWTLSHPAVDVALVGARRPSQLDETVSASGVSLSEDDRAAIGRMLEDTGPVERPSPEMRGRS
jgi:aryl-alcohol dehydrogenase-like predicted oxidoreductase